MSTRLAQQPRRREPATLIPCLTAQNARIWTAVLMIGTERASVQIGGYRATTAASDRHEARLAFQSASVLIAESVRLAAGTAKRGGCAQIIHSGAVHRPGR